MSSETQPSDRKITISSFFGNFELVVAILLGVVSIVTAYASFQGALYDSQMAGSYQVGSNLSTEAESLYLEANQQFVQDTQVYNRLTELTVEIESSDPAIATDAQAKYDVLEFQAVSEEFGAAIANADELNANDPDFYYSPLDDEDYQDFLFSDYADTKANAEAVIKEGDSFNSYSDQLELYTVLMTISLFLLGIAAVVRQQRVQWVLAGTGTAIFIVSAILTALVPFVSL